MTSMVLLMMRAVVVTVVRIGSRRFHCKRADYEGERECNRDLTKPG